MDEINNDIHIIDINDEIVSEIKNGNETKRGSYKIKKSFMAGTIVVSMVPFLFGCGRPAEFPDSEVGYSYFTEEEKNCDYIVLGTEMTNNALNELEFFGEDIRAVYISNCYFIDDLSKIIEYCPNVEEVYIEYSPSISDLSFIYSMPNLKVVSIKESGYVTPELVEYLNSKGIEHNITQEDLEDALELDRIISEIITDDMTDEEKIQAVTVYVINNYKYKITKVFESNDRPLSSTLDNKGGVCASYAYLTNILLRKAGINSYEVTSDDLLLGHAWNMIEIDGKYYYLDATNIKQIPLISNILLKHFNIGFFYMTDPKATGLSPMVDYDKVEKINIPQEMIEDIERGESEKNIYEKYGNSVPARLIEFILLITAITTGITLASKGMSAVHHTISYHKYSKAKEKQRKRKKYGTSSNSRNRRRY